jgi:gamma-glutamyltranspeptidase/glutathione hydrolase
MTGKSTSIAAKGSCKPGLASREAGSRIITAVLEVLLGVIDHRMPLSRILMRCACTIKAARRDHGRALDAAATMKALKARCHNLAVHLVTPERFVGAADTRTRGALAAGH